MNKFIIFAVRSITFSLIIGTQSLPTVYAMDPEADYWSVGVFSTAENAMLERARLMGMMGLPIQIAVFAEGKTALFRLVIEKDSDPRAQKRTILDSGITPWSIAFDHDRLLEPESLDAHSIQDLEYYLVLAGFRSKNKAEMLMARFNQNNAASFRVEESEWGGAPWYRVVHGPFTSPEKAVKAEVNSLGVEDAWWVRRKVEESNSDSVL